MLDGAQFEALRALVLTFSTEEQLAKMIDFTINFKNNLILILICEYE